MVLEEKDEVVRDIRYNPQLEEDAKRDEDGVAVIWTSFL